jgi:hypothetical protein
MRAPLLLALASLAISTAQAVEPTRTLTLACKGIETTKSDEHSTSEKITMGLVVDFQNKTVIGFAKSSVPIHISAVDKTTISFFASDGYWSLSGTIDRATGMVLAASERANPNTGNLVWALSYLLQCRSMQANAKDVMLGSRGN